MPDNLAAPLWWSRDGKWIAYSDWENGGPGNRSFFLNVETLERHQLPRDPSCRHEGNLTFSPSGQELAMICVHKTTSSENFIIDFPGKTKQSLITLHAL